MNYPFNEKELMFQAYTVQEADTYYISLKSDPKILQQFNQQKNGTAGAIANVAHSKLNQ